MLPDVTRCRLHLQLPDAFRKNSGPGRGFFSWTVFLYLLCSVELNSCLDQLCHSSSLHRPVMHWLYNLLIYLISFLVILNSFFLSHFLYFNWSRCCGHVFYRFALALFNYLIDVLTSDVVLLLLFLDLSNVNNFLCELFHSDRKFKKIKSRL